MTLRHLRIFVSVATHGSMSAAAKELYISQPSVSQAVRELEEFYGVLLFDRLAKRLYITAAGRQLLHSAQQVTAQYAQMEKAMREQQITQTLRVGASLTVGTCVLPQALAMVQTLCPGVHTNVQVNNTMVMEQQLLNGTLDAAVVEGNVTSTELVCTPVMPDELVLVCAKEHPLYARSQLCAQDLAGYGFAMRERGSGTRALFEHYANVHNLRIDTLWEAPCPEALRRAVLCCGCLAVISERLVAQEAIDGSVRIWRADGKEWQRSFKLVTHKDKCLTPAMEALQTALVQLAQSTAAPLPAGRLKAE